MSYAHTPTVTKDQLVETKLADAIEAVITAYGATRATRELVLHVFDQAVKRGSA
jgi:hypothetical protein